MAVQTTERAQRLPLELLLLGVVGFLWGAQFGFTKIQLESMPPVTSVAIRLMFGAVFMWGIVIAQGVTVPFGFRTWRDFATQGLLTSAGPGGLIAWGQQYVDSALAAILNSTSPILVMLVTLLYTRQESIGPRRFLGLAIGLGGVITIIGFEALKGLDRGFAGQIVIMMATLGLCQRDAVRPPLHGYFAGCDRGRDRNLLGDHDDHSRLHHGETAGDRSHVALALSRRLRAAFSATESAASSTSA